TLGRVDACCRPERASGRVRAHHRHARERSLPSRRIEEPPPEVLRRDPWCNANARVGVRGPMNDRGHPLKPSMELMGAALPQDTAHLHVAGEADYIDDIAEPRGCLHTAVGKSTVAHGRILSLDLDPVRAAPGVVAVLQAADIPGINDVGPVMHD